MKMLLIPHDVSSIELVGLGSSSSMDSFASWKINGSGMEKEEREETPLQGEDESRRSSPP